MHLISSPEYPRIMVLWKMMENPLKVTKYILLSCLQEVLGLEHLFLKNMSVNSKVLYVITPFEQTIRSSMVGQLSFDLQEFLAFLQSNLLMSLPFPFLSYEPRCEKTGLWGFRPGPTQTGLYSRKRWLEA